MIDVSFIKTSKVEIERWIYSVVCVLNETPPTKHDKIKTGEWDVSVPTGYPSIQGHMWSKITEDHGPQELQEYPGKLVRT